MNQLRSYALWAALSGFAALGAGCTDPGTSQFEWYPYEPGSTCEVARVVFGPYCVSCHNGTKEPLDLRGPALAALAGKLSDTYGIPLVTAGDPDNSFLYKKCTGPGADQGELMPATGLPQAALDTLRSWIQSGAPACEGSGGDIQVGGPVPFGGPPSGFAATQPGWAADGICSSDQWWQHQGANASDLMHPGNDCIACHSMGEGPGFDYAGTVYPALYDPDDCRGVPGVRVEILNGDDVVVAASVSNAAGNFSMRGGWVDGYRARLTYDGRTREMNLPVNGNGSCNSCHGPTGTEGSPGRVVAP